MESGRYRYNQLDLNELGSSAMGARRALFVTTFALALAGCGSEQGSVSDTPKGPPFAVLVLAPPSPADAGAFERRLRTEFQSFATEAGLKFADDSDTNKKIHSKDHLVWLFAYEKDVSVLVGWNIGSFEASEVALFGDATGKRPREVYASLLKHLSKTGMQYTVKKAPNI
jgi:hypothetical protein